jgi:DNA gyrase/topoisomerase IV subunit A
MATNIPPPPREVCDAVGHLDHPDATPADPMKFVKG